jgi:hypothetical protein
MMARMKRVAAWMLVAALIGGTAGASVVDMRALVAADANLLHHYTFEGNTATQRQQDKAGGLDLGVNSYGSGSGVSYTSGPDISSFSLRPQVLSGSSGAGLQSSGLSLSNTITVEALVSPNGENGGTYQYAVCGPGSPTRAYFLFLDKSDGDLETATGGTSFSDGNAQRDVVSGFKKDHWYYVASTFQNAGGNTTVNSYVADVSAGDTTLTQTLSGAVISGTYGTSGNLGVGMFQSGSNEAFHGKVDEVAIYDGAALSQATLQSHLDALVETTASKVSKMRGLVQNHPGLIHYYPFEGDATQRLQDSAPGGTDLEELAYGSGDTNAIEYVVGLDGSTQAYRPQRLSRFGAGAGLRTESSVTLPSTLSVEAIVCPENLEAGGEVGYAVEGRGSPARAYFLAQIEQSGDDDLVTIIGDNFTQSDNRREILDPFEPGHWYYVVNTFEESGGNTTINSYIADLTAGELVMTHVLNNVVASGGFAGSDFMGIGTFATGGGVQEAWAGLLDEVAIYDQILEPWTIQEHLWALTNTPEPGTLSLLALGGIGLLRRRRRRA